MTSELADDLPCAAIIPIQAPRVAEEFDTIRTCSLHMGRISTVSPRRPKVPAMKLVRCDSYLIFDELAQHCRDACPSSRNTTISNSTRWARRGHMMHETDALSDILVALEAAPRVGGMPQSSIPRRRCRIFFDKGVGRGT